MSSQDFSFLSNHAEQVASQLLGCLLERTVDGQKILVKIVETEAYDQDDAASHSYKHKTPRTDVMFGPPGNLYVYFTYGMHYCCNVVTGEQGRGSAVLIRAVEPLNNQEYLESVRGRAGHEVTNGPAKLCQALGIDKTFNGHDLSQEPIKLIPQDPLPKNQIVTTTRIGISQAKDSPWRFYIKDNPWVSKP